MKQEPLLIRNVLVCDKERTVTSDVLIKNGLIVSVKKNISKACSSIDCENHLLMPSFIDLHAHFRDPGYTFKEDIITGSEAAVKGGYTTVNLMANTSPVCNGDALVERNVKKAKKTNLIDIFQTCSITKDFNGTNCDHLEMIKSKFCKMISDDGNGVESDVIMKKAMEIAKKKGLIVSSHAEYKKLSKSDTRSSENLMTQRDIKLCEETMAHLHMAHVSTKEALEMIKKAKLKGLNITCECTPHHLVLTDEINYSVHPPLRKQADVDAMIQGIHDGTIDCIATDHAPHRDKDKINGAPGMSSIEIAFSICYTKLVKTGKITLNQLSQLMSFSPANILGINSGIIKEGIKADFVIINTEEEYKVNESDFLSKGKNTPFMGRTLFGKVIKVYKDGILKYDNGRIVKPLEGEENG